MANKALATRQRMQFRVEPSQAPVLAKGRGSQARKVLPDYLTAKKNTKPLSPPATAAKKPGSQEEN